MQSKIYQTVNYFRRILLVYLIFNFYPTVSFSQSVEYLVNEGMKNFEELNFRAAIFYFTKAIDKDPTNVRAYTFRGVSKAGIEDYRGAISDITKAFEIDSRTRKIYFLYSTRGYARMKLLDYENALSDFTRAIELNSTIGEVFYLRGMVKFELGKYQDAISDFNKAIEIDKNDFNSYLMRGSAKEKIGDYKGADEDILKAGKLKPEIILATLSTLADKYIAQQNYETAIKLLNYFLILKEDDLKTLLLLSIIYFHKNDINNSKKYFEMAKQINPDIKYGYSTIKKLEGDSIIFRNEEKETLKKIIEIFR